MPKGKKQAGPGPESLQRERYRSSLLHCYIVALSHSLLPPPLPSGLSLFAATSRDDNNCRPHELSGLVLPTLLQGWIFGIDLPWCSCEHPMPFSSRGIVCAQGRAILSRPQIVGWDAATMKPFSHMIQGPEYVLFAARSSEQHTGLRAMQRMAGGRFVVVRQLLIIGVLVLASSVGCKSPYYADKGAALGGLAGGLAGAAIGGNNGNAAGGALLGGAVGALSGAVIGDSMDEEVARRQALIEAKTGRRMVNAVTTNDVTTMVTSGLSDDVIINHIRANGVAAPLTPGDIIRLHDQGVSENVINAMQQASIASVASTPPVVVEETYVVPHYWSAPPYYYRHPPPPRYYYRRPGVSWGFSYAR